MADRNVCPVCETPSITREPLHQRDGDRITCSRCSRYDISGIFELALPHKPKSERLLLSGIIRNGSERSGGRFAEPIEEENYQRILNSSGAPTTVDGQIEALLVAIADREAYFSRSTPTENGEVWAARAYTWSHTAVREMAQELAAKGILKKDAYAVDPMSFTLTIDGWREVARIRQTRGSGDQCFIASWFHDDFDVIVNSGIIPALKATGYRPMWVKGLVTEDKLDDVIIAEIRRSALLIADVTGERPNVYYEAGFARGLGISTIFCCHKSWTTTMPAVGAIVPHDGGKLDTIVEEWTERLHFDTDHYQHLFYDSPEDLKERLTNRVRALGKDLTSSR